LTAYCLLNEIATPTHRELGRWRGKLPRVKLSPQQVQVLLGREAVADVAKKAGVSEEHLRRYCRARGIAVPGEKRPEAPAADLEVIKAAVTRELLARNGGKLKPVEALELVLSRAPHGLTDREIIAVLHAAGTPFTSMQIRYVVMQAAKGRFERYNGRVHRMQPEASVDLNKLKQAVSQATRSKAEWTKLDAIRCVLGHAKKGLSLEQLSTALAWFGIQAGTDALKLAVRRWAAQARLQLYLGTVTLPDTAPSWDLRRVEDREPTPNLASIQAAVCREFALLANQKLTNVEMMEFVLRHAPDGLWNEEFLGITKSLGVDFKESCMHSVTGKETKGRFRRKNGRVSLVGPPTVRITLNELQHALDGRVTAAKQSTYNDLFVEALKSFPDGLDLLDLQAAVGLLGYRRCFAAFKGTVYRLASQGRIRVNRGHAVVSTPRPPGSIEPPVPTPPPAAPPQ
jgi:hypothetical protein